ncbi:DUF2238 domain-containing protein [bacterium]|nr:DUF2238 domain-containing protein [bacterium]
MKIAWIVTFFAVLIWSGIQPHDRFTWVLEVLPALIALVVLIATYTRFRLTTLSYTLILVHSIILMVGGHYTYAEVPLFNWLRDLFDLERNNYDKVGHLAQGFIPAIIAREIFIRLKVINGRSWLNFLVICLCLAVSAFYEFIEWWVAALTGESAEAFLGTQGYVWDTQSDMLLAGIGASLALLIFTRLHDRQLEAGGYALTRHSHSSQSSKPSPV